MINAIITRCLDDLSERTGYAAIGEGIALVAAKDEVTLGIQALTQLNSFCCGATAGFTVAGTFHPQADFGEFYAAVHPDPDLGVSRTRLVRALRGFGVGVRQERGLAFEKIRRAIDDGFPIITDIYEPGQECGHWVVLYGYGRKPRRVFLAVRGLPFFNRNRYAWEEFSRWQTPGKIGLVCWGK